MKVITVPLAYTNCYLIQAAQGWILVDAGRQSVAELFQRQLGKLGIDSTDIKLIIITHAHFDHVGSLAQIKDLCGCPVLAHPLEARIIEAGEVVIPPGTNWLGNMVSWVGKRSTRMLGFAKTTVEITADDEYDLTPFGVAGKIIPTPGHTPGSISVLLEDGQALVGDLAMNMVFRSHIPIFTEEPSQISSSWEMLINKGATVFYPAHGRRLPISKLRGIKDSGSV